MDQSLTGLWTQVVTPVRSIPDVVVIPDLYRRICLGRRMTKPPSSSMWLRFSGQPTSPLCTTKRVNHYPGYLGDREFRGGYVRDVHTLHDIDRATEREQTFIF